MFFHKILSILDKILLMLTAYLLVIMIVLLSFVGMAECNNYEYKFSFVYGICPVLHIKDSNYIILDEPKQAVDLELAAVTLGPVIVYGHHNYNDTNIIVHEETHVKQNYRWFLAGVWLLDKFNYYQVYFEYEAYKAESINVPNHQIALLVSLNEDTADLPYEAFFAIVDKNLELINSFK